MNEGIVRLEGVCKRFGGMLAVDRLTFEIRRGEFFSMLGPSGCGKTTTLRMIGGFVQPDDGEIYLEGAPISGVPPYRRNVNTVFQSYALFEHLSVWENVAFGLKRRKVEPAAIRERVGRMLELVHLENRARARPRQLSGGQQQRVALARALVNLPAVLLLDEPLGSLDFKLRKEMQLELLHLQREVGITFIFVTHDQEEAMTMSDRIAIMRDGVLQQCGRPEDVYERPCNAFVADFMGVSNLLPVTVGASSVRLANGLSVPVESQASRGLAEGTSAFLSIRPEKLHLTTTPETEAMVGLDATIVETIYQGMLTQYIVELGGGVRLTAIDRNVDRESSTQRLAPGTRVEVRWKPHHALVLEP